MVAKCLLLCLASTPVAGSCSQPAIRQAADELIDARRSLLTIQQEEMDTRVPPAARQGILKLKDAIAHLAGAYMACRTDPLDAKQIELDLAALVPATGDGKYGSTYPSKSPSPRTLASGQHHRDLRHPLRIGCHAADLRAARNLVGRGPALASPALQTSVRRVLVLSTPHLPARRNGSLVRSHISRHAVVLLHLVEHRIQYLASRSKTESSSQAIRVDVVGSEEFGTLAASQNSADIVFTAPASTAAFIAAYSFVTMNLRRFRQTRPARRRNAPRLRHEWIVSPWTEAQHWSAPGLGGFHRQAKKYASEFKSTQKCSDWPDTVQIGVTDIKTEGFLSTSA